MLCGFCGFEIGGDDCRGCGGGCGCGDGGCGGCDCGCGCGGCSTSANVVSEFKSTLSKELQFEVTTFLDKPTMDNKLNNVLEIKDVINIILNEGIKNVLTEKVQSEFTKIIEQTK
mgnify:CR=1 FL=1